MKTSWIVCLGVLLGSYSVHSVAGTLDLAPKEVAAPPLQKLTSPGQINIVEENVNFAPDGNDRHYTNGITLSYTTGTLGENRIWNAPMRWLGEHTWLFERSGIETDNRMEWTILGQSFFTPQDHALSDPKLDDRPYAGWLYSGVNFIQDYNAQQLTSLEFLGGFVGSWALGRQVQNNTHALLNEELARGWNHQLSNEFGFTVSWDRKWRFNHELQNQYSWEIIPDAGITAGNVFTYGQAGMLLRWGRGLKADWGPQMIRPGYSGTSYFAPERGGVKLGWNIFLGAEGRAVARNIFLDGNTFQNSRNVNKEPVVADLFIGTELFTQGGLRFGFSLVARSPEFDSQRGIDTFGSFNGSYQF